MAAITICSDFGAQRNKVSHCFHCFPIYLLWSDGTGFHDLSFPFTFIKRLFSSSSLSAVRAVSSAYLRLLIFLPAILISACASSSPAFLMMHSAYKLNKQGDNIQPWYTPFPIWNQSVVPCPVLTLASWPAYRFLKRQVRLSGIPISFRIFLNMIKVINEEITANIICRASQVVPVVKNLPAKQEMQVQYLGREDPLEKEMVTHYSILAWEIPWSEGLL